MVSKLVPVSVAAAAALPLIFAASPGWAQAKGGYTAAQAARGTAVFSANCAVCHGESMSGGPGTPALAGAEFMYGWKDKTAADLYVYLKANMPPGSPGSFSDQQYADVVAVILKANDHAPGDTELTPDPATQKGVKIGASAP